MLKAYQYRIYPNNSQKELLNKHFGACRLIYNLALEVKQQTYKVKNKNISAFDMMKQLPDLKKECGWLKEINAQSLQNAIVNLDKAYTAFFKGGKYPNFKSKRSKQSFSCPQKSFIDGNKIYLIKFGDGIKIELSREFKGQIKTVTISRTPTGKYYASVLVDNKMELPIKSKIKESTAVGIDVGIKNFVTLSNGESVDNPKYLRNSIERLKVLQSRASKKKKGNANRKKANHRVALLHEKITNQRKDFLHKLSTKIIRDNQTICVESLNVSGMVKNRKLARSISDCGWSMFFKFLKYKSEWYGKNYIEIGRFEPSSKICSECGATNHALTLTDREWVCANCGTLHDRDCNAAKNIKSFALKNSRRGTPVVPVEQPTLVGAMKQEYEL